MTNSSCERLRGTAFPRPRRTWTRLSKKGLAAASVGLAVRQGTPDIAPFSFLPQVNTKGRSFANGKNCWRERWGLVKHALHQPWIVLRMHYATCLCQNKNHCLSSLRDSITFPETAAVVW
ncbi:hypothetical protein LZ31DRAFT_143810 [Colletotrichum somersetense]|nr:hypothetical protein LZ31DRAFT_143810 [Colletotrichum somersetense]